MLAALVGIAIAFLVAATICPASAPNATFKNRA
jgi:hypothetical protein